MVRQLFISLALVVLLAACGRTVTPAELEGYEARDYAGHGKGEVVKATVTALRSLGYEVVAVDAAAGRVKTAPKLMVVHAARTSSTTAIATGDSIAWSIDVTGGASGAHVHAEPRLYRAGGAVDATQLNATYAERTFSTLYREIDSNLTSETQTTSAARGR